MAPYACSAKFKGLAQEKKYSARKGNPLPVTVSRSKVEKSHMPSKVVFECCAKFHTASADSYLHLFFSCLYFNSFFVIILEKPFEFQ